MMEEMQIDAFKATDRYLGHEVVKRIQVGFEVAPVVLVAPVFHQAFEFGMSNFEVIPFNFCHAIIESSILEFDLYLLQ